MFGLTARSARTSSSFHSGDTEITEYCSPKYTVSLFKSRSSRIEVISLTEDLLLIIPNCVISVSPFTRYCELIKRLITITIQNRQTAIKKGYLITSLKPLIPKRLIRQTDTPIPTRQRSKIATQSTRIAGENLILKRFTLESSFRFINLL